MAKNYWLMKSEPDAYSWDDLVAEGEGTWDGVRNHRAANNLRAMQVGDEFFFYHSNIGLEIVGVAKVSQAGLVDPSDPEGKWAAVKVKPVRKLKRPVTLKQIKADPKLAEMELVKLSRLSVAVVEPDHWAYILALSEACSVSGLGYRPEPGKRRDPPRAMVK
jgi:predicted RNA-binding protein with PUA-like domain